jgi:uncharacterized protein YyaL (SSP411 family)
MLNNLVNWFLYSPVFNGQAYLEYYSPKKKGPPYPEITGYATSLSCILYERKRNSKFLDRAETCAGYMNKITRNGAVPCLRDNLLYTFDTGVYVSSLFDLYAFTKKETYLHEAEDSLKWLHSLWNSRPYAAVNNIPKNRDWYHVPSVHLAKLAIPFMKASKYLKDEKHMETAFALLDKYKKLQEDDGGFRINENSVAIMVHPHCYATEGFLYAYHISKRREFLEVAEKSSNWLCKTQNSDGSFYRWYGKGKKVKRGTKLEKVKATDATAQATRIWKILGVNREGIEKGYSYLNSEFRDGGLRLYKTASTCETVCSWPTFFYIHSLVLPFGQIEYCKEIF